jgi:hypothetical protein
MAPGRYWVCRFIRDSPDSRAGLCRSVPTRTGVADTRASPSWSLPVAETTSSATSGRARHPSHRTRAAPRLARRGETPHYLARQPRMTEGRTAELRQILLDTGALVHVESMIAGSTRTALRPCAPRPSTRDGIGNIVRTSQPLPRSAISRRSAGEQPRLLRPCRLTAKRPGTWDGDSPPPRQKGPPTGWETATL